MLVKKYISTVGIILTKNNKILLVKHLEKSGHVNGIYGLPAGRIENSETEEDCAIRELREETNLDIEKEFLEKIPKIYYASIKRKSGEIKDYSMTVFICSKFNGNLKQSEETFPVWVDLNEIDNIFLLPSQKEVINDYKNSNSSFCKNPQNMLKY